MAVTLQQIAEAAGVSRGTVDRALNNRGRIKPDVEEKIKKIAKEMGYQPSRAGRALAFAKRNIKIGVIIQYAETPFMKRVLEGVKAAKAEVESFGGTVEIMEIQGAQAGEVVALMDRCREQGVSGLAIVPSEDQLLRDLIDKYTDEYKIPIVTFNSDLDYTKRICFVGQNAYQSGRTAAGLMGEIVGGDGQVAVITGYSSNTSLNNRMKGFISQLQMEYPYVEVLEPRYSYDDEWVASKIVDELLLMYPELSGIYITGHGVRGVCEALKTKGRDRDIKVIANDFLEENQRWLREGTINFLIGQDSYVQGHAPVTILFQLLFDNQMPEREKEYTEIVIKNKFNI